MNVDIDNTVQHNKTLRLFAAAPCELPHISHGQYLLGYRAGLTIGNGSSVMFQCDTDYKPSTGAPVECVLGELRPHTPSCRKGKTLLHTCGLYSFLFGTL